MSKKDQEKINVIVLVWLWLINFFSIKKEALPQPGKPPEQLPADPKYPDGNELPQPDEDKFIRLGIIVGHEKGRKGASNIVTEEREYDYNIDIANRIVDFCIASGKLVQPKVIFRDGIGIKGAYAKAEEEKCDLVIELHFNASVCGEVSGSEVLCTSFLNDLEFAHVVQKYVCQVFKRKGLSRGVKAIGRNVRGGFNVHSFPNGANCLVEPFFGSHPNDASMGDTYRQEYAECLVYAAEMYAKKLNLL